MRVNSILRQKLKSTFYPQSTLRIFKGKKQEKPQLNTRYNEIDIQMLPQQLYQQIFGSSSSRGKQQDAKVVKSIKDALQHFDIELEKSPKFEDVDLRLPKLKGDNLVEHFYAIAQEQVAEYECLLNAIIACKVPRKPEKWSFDTGWTKYDTLTGTSQAIDYPDDDVLVFDVELCVGHGQNPILATAMGQKCWYSWVSQDLHDNTAVPHPKYSINHLIPLESSPTDTSYSLTPNLKRPKVVIGHNVSFDRAKVKEQYWMESTGARFLDTMSLHVCVSGMTSYQRAMLKSHKEMSEDDLGWSAQTSLNSLVEVYRLYCGGELQKEARDIFVKGQLSDVRENFQELVDYCSKDVNATFDVVKVLFPLFKERFAHPATLAGMLEIGSAYLPVNNNWERYKKDSDLSYEDYNIESKYLLTKRADEVCKLLHNDEYKNDLWMWDQDWSTQSFKMKKISTKVNDISILEVEQRDEVEGILTTEEKLRLDTLKTKFDSFIAKTSLRLPARRTLLPGYPAWYRKMCDKLHIPDWSPGPQNIGTGMQVVPKLLHICWEGYPLHFIRAHGWGFLVPYKIDEETNTDFPIAELLKKCPVVESPDAASQNESEEAMSALWKDIEVDLMKKQFWAKKKVATTEPRHNYEGTGVWCNVELDNCCWFYKLPHKDGVKMRVGNPLAKDFLNKFSENVLSGDGAVAERVIDIARMVSYWRNNRDRIHNQMAVWLDDGQSLPPELQNTDQTFGAIVPQVVVCGTLTRRAMEPTWMTASNAQRERIGSELRAMIQAPPGYKIVGADVDSQELWIASILGDASESGIHGATPLGWMTLSGAKSSGTDMHSVTAKAIGISRDHAKVINYARIYGAGQNFAQRLLKQFNPAFSEGEAKSKAMKMFRLTKGKKLYYLRDDFDGGLERRGYSGYEALKIAASFQKSVLELFEKAQWSGGTESAMFNRLEEIAECQEPVTPFLGSRLSRALEPQGDGDDRFLPTRINWVVQSGAVDFLHLMLVCMRWLMGSNVRFCLSFHDELRYLVKDEYAYKAALAMHVTNLLTRSFCVAKIGLHDLPMSVAFFTSVEVDSVLRKESQMDCKTPSNPHGLERGYGILPGEPLDIYAAVKKAGGHDLQQWEWHKSSK